MSNRTIPHFWIDIQGWFDFDDIYHDMVHKFAIENRKYKFAEVGCWKGKSTAFMAVEIANSEKDIDFYCIDTWKGSKEHITEDSKAFEPMCLTEDGIYDIFIKNMNHVLNYIKPMRMSSIEAASKFENDFFDFVFIDASHEYEDIKNDIDTWYPKVRYGGILAGHDYGWFYVKKAVDEFIANKNIEISKSRSSWIIKK